MRDLLQDILILVRVHSRVLLSLVIIVFSAWVVFTVGFWVVSGNPKSCLMCHYERPFYEGWAASTHKEVTCVACHPVGVTFATVNTVKYLTGLYSPVPRARVENQNCLQAGCHQQRLKQGKVQVGAITFDHNLHLEPTLRDGNHLWCSSCHGQMVQGRHMVADLGVCFLCHFKGAPAGQSVTGCPSCHGTPTKVVEHDGFAFSHESYLRIGVECRQCHLQVKEGDGEVPRERCHRCHVERVAFYNQPVAVHKRHVNQNGIDCLECHEPIRHGEVQMIQALEIRCENCHPRLHSNQKELYLGASARGVADQPSRMFAAQVTCDGCHTHPVTARSQGAAAPGEQSLEAERRSCLDCHGPGYDQMLDTWIREGDRMLAAVLPEINTAESLLKSDRVLPEARPLLADAVFNYDLVQSGRPAHNVEYAVRILQTAWDQMDVARAATEPGYKPKLRPAILGTPDGYCTAMCHSALGLPEKTVFIEMKLEFPHRRHVEEIKVPCTTCHSPDQHKMRIIDKAGCMQCHHGKEDMKCETCHSGIAALRQAAAKGAGVKPRPDPMADALSCADCHNLLDPAQTVREIKPRCIACHEQGYGDLLIQWDADWRNSRVKVEALIEAAKLRIDQDRREGKDTAAAEKGLAEAEGNFQIADAGRGVHNFDYAMDLLQAAEDRLNRIVGTPAGADEKAP